MTSVNLYAFQCVCERETEENEHTREIQKMRMFVSGYDIVNTDFSLSLF